MVEPPVEHGAGRSGIPQQFSPVLHGRLEVNSALVAPHDDFQQMFGGGEGQLAHSKIVDDMI
jgi:hypothetical protein